MANRNEEHGPEHGQRQSSSYERSGLSERDSQGQRQHTQWQRQQREQQYGQPQDQDMFQQSGSQGVYGAPQHNYANQPSDREDFERQRYGGSQSGSRQDLGQGRGIDQPYFGRSDRQQSGWQQEHDADYVGWRGQGGGQAQGRQQQFGQRGEQGDRPQYGGGSHRSESSSMGYGSYAGAGARGQGQGYGSSSGYGDESLSGGYGGMAGGYGSQGQAFLRPGDTQSGASQSGTSQFGTSQFGTSQYGMYGASRGGFRGKGPKSYSRSDERIVEDVNERLTQDDDIDASEIEVKAQQGVVTLEGTVEQRWMKHRVEDLAESCSGVREVENRLKVQSGAARSSTSGEQSPAPGAAGQGSSGRIAH